MNEISIGGLPLDTLAEMANEAAELAERDMVSAVGRAWDCGRYLLAAKAQVPHGQWMHWVRVNFDRELRTASRYMQLAGAFPTRAAIAEAASIRQAMRMISQPEEVVVDEPELVEEIEAEPEVTPEIEPQERPSIRRVSAESRKVSEADREPTPEVRPVVEPELVAEAEEAVVLYIHVDVDTYVVADADEVAAAALQLHEPMALVRMAVMAVEPDDMGAAIDSLRLAADWLESQIEERRA